MWDDSIIVENTIRPNGKGTVAIRIITLHNDTYAIHVIDADSVKDELVTGGFLVLRDRVEEIKHHYKSEGYLTNVMPH